MTKLRKILDSDGPRELPLSANPGLNGCAGTMTALGRILLQNSASNRFGQQ
jgi:hypothetical protein